MIFNTNKPPIQLVLSLLDPAGGRVVGETLRADHTICIQIEGKGFPPEATITGVELENIGNERHMPIQLQASDLRSLANNCAIVFRIRMLDLASLVTNPGSQINLRVRARLEKGDAVVSNAAALQDPAPMLVRLVATTPTSAPESGIWKKIRDLKVTLVPKGFEIDPDIMNSETPFLELRKRIGVKLNEHRMPDGYRSVPPDPLKPNLVRNIIDPQIQALDDLGHDGNRLPPLQPPGEKGSLHFALNKPPFFELIYDWWVEVGMLSQSFHLVAHRFQNYRASRRVARLSHLNIASLRPVSGLLFDWLSQQHQVRTVHSRVHAYLHEFNCSLPGSAARPIAPVRSELGFSAAFHGVLHAALRYYAQVSEVTWVPDAFPLLTALRTLSEVLKRTEVNTFQRTAFEARREFASYGVILGTPEVRRFLVTEGIPSREPWIPAVDAINELAGWRVGSMLNFLDLATEGERILASVRWFDWDSGDVAMAQAWGDELRQAVQLYCYRFKILSGLDLGSDDLEHLCDHALPMSTLAYRRLGIAA